MRFYKCREALWIFGLLWISSPSKPSIPQVAAATAAGAAAHRGVVRRREEGALETVVAALEEALDPRISFKNLGKTF